MKQHARPHPTYVAEDPRMRAYWAFHGNGSHKVPWGGTQPDHFYACSWCDTTVGVRHECIPETIVYSTELPGNYSCRTRPVYDDREVECFRFPQSAAADPIGALREALAR